MSPLRPAPEIVLEFQEDLSPPADPEGFVRLVRRRWVARYPDGSRSAPFVYDALERRAMDVVVMAAHYRRNGRHHVYLRSSVRPPLLVRGEARLPLDAGVRGGSLWELPAGLVEPEEESEAGLLQAAQRELEEETGFHVEPAALRRLGPNTFPAPGLIGEQHIFFEVEVDPDRRQAPSLDGSALEHGGAVIALPLDEALDCCTRGEIPDGKTELALRRLRDRLA